MSVVVLIGELAGGKGTGAVSSAAKVASRAGDAAQAADRAGDVAQAADKAEDIAQGANRAGDANNAADAAGDIARGTDRAGDASDSTNQPSGSSGKSGEPGEGVQVRQKVSLRNRYMGRTPGKKSRTGREVQERMRKEGKLREVWGETEFLASNGKWYPLREADMSHKVDAVSWWNKLCQSDYMLTAYLGCKTDHGGEIITASSSAKVPVWGKTLMRQRNAQGLTAT